MNGLGPVLETLLPSIKWTGHACTLKTEAHVILVFQIVICLAAGAPFRRETQSGGSVTAWKR